ncbi:MAG: site-specific DNA-methyltransferase, partial [Oscillospiraceae bacterium]
MAFIGCYSSGRTRPLTSYSSCLTCVKIEASRQGSRDIIKYEDDSSRLIWNGKGQSLGEDQPSAYFKETQRVFVRPLFAEQNIFCAEEVEQNQDIDNRYFFGDNLEVLKYISENDDDKRIKLIYIDPPYMSQMQYRSITKDINKNQHSVHAFEDRWGKNTDHYLDMLYPRLLLMHQVLHANGSIFVHVDWHVSHYVRVLLDEIFGRDNFINEIIWCYSGGGNARKNLQRKHDTIFWYARSQDFTFNHQYRPYTQGTMERGLTAVKGDHYQLSEKGAMLQDWWTDINKILSPTAYENLKYPTQKPKKLLERLINLASNPGDLVADFFGGSATTAEMCNQMDRPWILCDNSALALQTSISRLIKNDSPPFSIYTPKQKTALSICLDDLPRSQSGALLTLKKPVFQDNGPENYWLSLGIDFYQPAILPDNWDALQFASYIEFWEIDSDYDEQIFKSQYQMLRKNNKVKKPVALTILISVPRKISYTMAIKIYDVFANHSTVKINFKA